MKLKQYVSGCFFLLSGNFTLASNESLVINYNLQAKPLDTVFVSTTKNQLREAQFNSGLGLALSNPLFDFNFDYIFKGNVQRTDGADNGQLSQTLTASIRSMALNDLLAVDVKVNADSVVLEEGDIYHYKITPVFSRSIYNLADLDIKYNYALAKPSAVDSAEETKGYSLGLNGAIGNGRLIWKSVYSESSIFKDQWLQTESIEAIDFNSRYHLIPDLHLEVSSTIKNITMLNGIENRIFSEKYFGAGISWSPNKAYSFALKVNKVNQSRFNQDEYYGGGAVTWSPKHDLELSLGYGDQLLDGVRGLIFSTRVDLDKS